MVKTEEELKQALKNRFGRLYHCNGLAGATIKEISGTYAPEEQETHILIEANESMARIDSNIYADISSLLRNQAATIIRIEIDGETSKPRSASFQIPKGNITINKRMWKEAQP